jgi:hypothetical protein
MPPAWTRSHKTSVKASAGSTPTFMALVFVPFKPMSPNRHVHWMTRARNFKAARKAFQLAVESASLPPSGANLIPIISKEP